MADTKDTQLKYVQRDGPWAGQSMNCVDTNDDAALNDHDNASAPQLDQAVEYDHRLATRTVENIARAKTEGKPFFVACGFRRPHLPFRVPERFLRMYDGVEIATPANGHFPRSNVTQLAMGMNGKQSRHNLGGVGCIVPATSPLGTGPFEQAYELAAGGSQRWRATTEQGEAAAVAQLPDDLVQDLRRGYMAAVSFMDFEVGRVLSGLDALGLAQDTAVLFHAVRFPSGLDRIVGGAELTHTLLRCQDHGWKLGGTYVFPPSSLGRKLSNAQRLLP